jgi:hypothetical protein
MADRNAALTALDFGRVDSESEPDLDRRFLRTDDFGRFLDSRNMLILGAKGSGKSALFEMFAKHLPATRKLAGQRLDGILLATGTGFGDLSELTTADIQGMQGLEGFQYESLWRLYIALKAGIALGQQGYSSTGPLRDLLRVIGEVRDYRVAPMLSSLWQTVGGNAPKEIQITVMGTGARIVSGKNTLDVIDLLEDVHTVLEVNGQRLWMLFDKIDGAVPERPRPAARGSSGSFSSGHGRDPRISRIVPRVFIRTDIYGPDLQFTNKSHFADKNFEIEWDEDDLRTLLLKRAVTAAPVAELVTERVPALLGSVVEALSPDQRLAAFRVIFDERAYPGRREAELLNWMIARGTDAHGSTYPREFITYGNLAKANQVTRGGPGDDGLVSGRAVVDAYTEVSRIRCETFLSEFPELRQHINRFRGQHDSPFTREELDRLFEGLEPAGLEAIERLHEVGVLSPAGGRDAAVADRFDVPRLYKSGLGLQIIARP